MPKISIIIPIYNVEQYIERCVRSLLEQTMDEIEFVFVNDCSPDSSMDILNKIIKEYPKRINNVVIINNSSNKGIAETRKIGINYCTGDYIGWCDSDDWVDTNMYEKLWEASNNGQIDIVVCNGYEEYETQKLTRFIPYNTPHEVLANCWKNKHMPYGLVFHLFKNNLIRQSINKLIYTRQGEDTYLMKYLYYHAKSIKYIPESLYHYNRNNTSSLTHTPKYTKEEWISHKRNIDNITSLLYSTKEGKKLFHTAINHLKFYRKQQFRKTFNSIYEYYNTYSECYKDFNIYNNTSKNHRIKTYLIHNIFFLFWLFYRNRWEK